MCIRDSSHVMAFAAEESRLTGRTVDVADFEKPVRAVSFLR